MVKRKTRYDKENSGGTKIINWIFYLSTDCVGTLHSLFVDEGDTPGNSGTQGIIEAVP